MTQKELNLERKLQVNKYSYIIISVVKNDIHLRLWCYKELGKLCGSVSTLIDINDMVKFIGDNHIAFTNENRILYTEVITSFGVPEMIYTELSVEDYLFGYMSDSAFLLLMERCFANLFINFKEIQTETITN
jgi:hypothetical protein